MGDLLNRFATEEKQFLNREFLAPALPGGVVGVRIGGVVCKIRIDPTTFEGWGVFQPVSHTEAKLVRQATLSERRSYLDLFPLIRQIVCRRAGNTWFGSAASFGDTRIRMEGLAPVQFVAFIAGLVAWFIAAKEALDLEWGQTILTVIIGWLVIVHDFYPEDRRANR